MLLEPASFGLKGLLGSTFKLKRFHAKEVYKSELETLYS
jgi:hypothetical protein